MRQLLLLALLLLPLKMGGAIAVPAPVPIPVAKPNPSTKLRQPPPQPMTGNSAEQAPEEQTPDETTQQEEQPQENLSPEEAQQADFESDSKLPKPEQNPFNKPSIDAIWQREMNDDSCVSPKKFKIQNSDKFASPSFPRLFSNLQNIEQRLFYDSPYFYCC
ncbi:MAG: hypothetical protein PUP90_31890 [Nostoc sp. S4]|nr:hypothetical protein [Nostoc sp. S4]